ncbi:MAG: MarR family transcriptional regulator, partial [Deltaproteobacteria bacterium]|nr:MarR family transcriptional regulator [Deltaproteobacteria bacterium]
TWSSSAIDTGEMQNRRFSLAMKSRNRDTGLAAVADAVGGLMEFWGFKRNMGRMWTVLYLSPEPLSAADLCERLSLSTGAVSMTANSLARWGVVKKVSKPGDRRDYFEPETNIWKMVSRVFRDRELRQIDVAIESFKDARDALEEAIPRTSGPERKASEFALERINGLYDLAIFGKGLLDAILSGKPFENPLKSLFKDAPD